MKSKIIAVILFTLIAAGTTFAFIMMAPTAKVPASQTKAVVPQQSIAASSPLPTQPGMYIDYSDNIITSTTGTKLLFFHAPWCPQCRDLEKDIKSTTLPSDVTIIKVDYDSQNDLRVKYGVTLQTTVVKISNDGELIKKYVAYNNPSFANVKQNLLD